jgi:hypothetical protein
MVWVHYDVPSELIHFPCQFETLSVQSWKFYHQSNHTDVLCKKQGAYVYKTMTFDIIVSFIYLACVASAVHRWGLVLSTGHHRVGFRPEDRDRVQSPKYQFKQKLWWWIMSTKLITLLIYHCHEYLYFIPLQYFGHSAFKWARWWMRHSATNVFKWMHTSTEHLALWNSHEFRGCDINVMIYNMFTFFFVLQSRIGRVLSSGI